MIVPLALIPGAGRRNYMNMCHPRVSSRSLIRSLIFWLGVFARADVRKPPDDMVMALVQRENFAYLDPGIMPLARRNRPRQAKSGALA